MGPSSGDHVVRHLAHRDLGGSKDVGAVEEQARRASAVAQLTSSVPCELRAARRGQHVLCDVTWQRTRCRVASMR
jgi:hypothetical protein